MEIFLKNIIITTLLEGLDKCMCLFILLGNKNFLKINKYYFLHTNRPYKKYI